MSDLRSGEEVSNCHAQCLVNVSCQWQFCNRCRSTYCLYLYTITLKIPVESMLQIKRSLPWDTSGFCSWRCSCVLMIFPVSPERESTLSLQMVMQSSVGSDDSCCDIHASVCVKWLKYLKWQHWNEKCHLKRRKRRGWGWSWGIWARKTFSPGIWE